MQIIFLKNSSVSQTSHSFSSAYSNQLSVNVWGNNCYFNSEGLWRWYVTHWHNLLFWNFVHRVILLKLDVSEAGCASVLGKDSTYK